MRVEILVPEIGESITEVEIGNWLKEVGEEVAIDEPIVEIESEKASVELPSPASGVLSEVRKQTGEKAAIGEVLGEIEQFEEDKRAQKEPAKAKKSEDVASPPSTTPGETPPSMPAAERALKETGLIPEKVKPTGPGGTLLKVDVLEARDKKAASKEVKSSAGTTEKEPSPAVQQVRGERSERVERMSVIRRTIASRLVQAKQNAALLTTFNEVDMFEIKKLRRQLGEEFAKRHGVRLGFMSFFVMAAVEALKRFPEINAEIRGDSIVYKDYYDIGIAIGSGKGLVVPILRDAQKMGFADIERKIADFAERVSNNKLMPQELEGGTFSISNGGVYGSVLSTPIVNPPQSAILGLHGIKDRPIALNGEVAIRPMMNLALTYDHRIVDGREAVTFLVTIKNFIETPTRMLLEI